MSWVALAVGGTAAIAGGVGAYMSSQQQADAANGLAATGYQVPNYDPAIDYLKSNWAQPAFQNYSPVSPNTGYEQFLQSGKYAPRINRMLQNITNRDNRQFRKDIDANTPNYRSSLRQLDQNVAGWNRGELSPETSAAVRRNSAFNAISGGYGGSEAARNLTARDLGLTSDSLQQRGAQLLPQVFAQSQDLDPHKANTLSYFMNPQQLFGAEVGQQQYANQVYNTNQTNAANIANQRAQLISNYMAQQQGANATGANTNAMLAYQAQSAPNPWISGLTTAAGSLASAYGGGGFGAAGSAAGAAGAGGNYTQAAQTRAGQQSPWLTQSGGYFNPNPA